MARILALSLAALAVACGPGNVEGGPPGGDRLAGDSIGGEASAGDGAGGDSAPSDGANADFDAGDVTNGDLNQGDTANGDLSGGDTAAGDVNAGDTANGDLQVGDRFNGDTSSGDTNTGDVNTGDVNTGDVNTGDVNTGDNAPPILAPAVTNLTDGETLRYDLAVLVGTADTSASTLQITNPASGFTDTFRVANGQFKGVVLLESGANPLTLTAAGKTTMFDLTYTPQTNTRWVRLIYVIAADGDGSFDAPAGMPNATANAVSRISVGARLLQTMTAEKMNALGHGRTTFRIGRDAQGDPDVEVFTSALTTATAWGMSGVDLWLNFWSEFSALPDRSNTIDIAIMGMTHYDGPSSTIYAHTALGGDRLGLFGSASLFTWAETLDGIDDAFLDATVVDTMQLFDDSASRGTYWANYSTTLGAVLHELGHSLSLPHPADHLGIMWRGFDNTNRSFVVAEPPHAFNPSEIAPLVAMDETFWNVSNGLRLSYHRWFALDSVTYSVNTPPTMTVGATDLRIQTTAGARHVEYVAGGEAIDHTWYPGASGPTDVTFTKAELAIISGGLSPVNVSVIDDDGNIARVDVPVP